MQTRNLALLLSAVLSTGVCLAQQTDPSQTAQQAPTAAAQQTMPHRATNPDKQAKRLGKQLGLSRDQVVQIEPIFADRQQQFQSLRADSSLSTQDRRSKMRAIQQDSKSKIEAVLNDAQKQQYEQMLADRRAHHKNRQSTQPQPGL